MYIHVYIRIETSVRKLNATYPNIYYYYTYSHSHVRYKLKFTLCIREWNPVPFEPHLQ